MESNTFLAVFALLLAALPFVALGLIVVAIFLVFVLLLGTVAILEQPPRYWMLAIMVALNSIVLLPIWLASWFVASSEPSLWLSAREAVFTFSAYFLGPTAVRYQNPSAATVRRFACLSAITTPPPSRRSGGEDPPHGAVRRLGRLVTADSPSAGPSANPSVACGRAQRCSRRHSRGASAADAAR